MSPDPFATLLGSGRGRDPAVDLPGVLWDGGVVAVRTFLAAVRHDPGRVAGARPCANAATLAAYCQRAADARGVGGLLADADRLAAEAAPRLVGAGIDAGALELACRAVALGESLHPSWYEQATAAFAALIPGHPADAR